MQKLRELNKGKHSYNYLKETNRAILHHMGPYMIKQDHTGVLGCTEENKISKSTKFLVKFNVFIHSYGLTALKN